MATDRSFTQKARILVAPLDWGLGHATRSIPLIKQLLELDAEVILAADGAIATLLKAEFPGLEFLELPGYRVKYASSAGRLPLKMLRQVPRILRTIRQEREWLARIIREYQIDAVIADNRFGLHNPGLPCVFITHQLTIRTGSALMDKLLRSFNYRFINRFNECWVPDEQGPLNYAGQLSHPSVMPRIPVHYMGILSRLNLDPRPVLPGHLFVSLSGPEPQRTIFEDTLIDQLSHYHSSATIVRGLPNEERLIPSTNSLRFFNHLPAQQVQEEMARAELVVSRSGYSTVMDLVRMGKKSVLVPTPGQTEQQYLAGYLDEKGMAMAARQENFHLDSLLEKASEYFKGRENPYENYSAHEDDKLSLLLKGLLSRLK